VSTLPPRRPVWPRALRALVVVGGLGWLASATAVVVVSRREGAQPADAIVVLGAAQYDGRPSPVLRARLDHGVTLYHRGMAPLLMLTGGRGFGDTTTEAAVGARYAERHGVPVPAVLVEDAGRTTSESMHAAATLLRARGATRVVLVSDPFHMLRLGILARRFGLTPYLSPTPTSRIAANPTEELKYVLSESVKVPLAFILERE
jgi:uncharacterized SAM-binding protein YcdF (DUF218 family)